MGSHFLCVNFPVCSRRQRRPRVGEIRRHRCRGQGPDPFGCIGSFYEGLVCVSSSGSLFGCCGVGAARLGAQAAPSSPLQPPRDVGRGRLSAGRNVSVLFEFFFLQVTHRSQAPPAAQSPLYMHYAHDSSRTDARADAEMNNLSAAGQAWLLNARAPRNSIA